MIESDDLSGGAYLRKLADSHDGAEERLDRLEKREKALQDVADTLGADGFDDSCSESSIQCDSTDSHELDDVPEAAEDMQDRLRELQWRYAHEDASWIAERTDRYGDTAEEVLEYFDRDPDRVIEERELAEDIIHN